MSRGPTRGPARGPIRDGGRGPGQGKALRALTLDATGTLFSAPRLAEIYAEVFSRHGLEAREEELAPVLRTVWQELACLTDGSRDRFATHPEGPRGWWRRYGERVAEHLGLSVPSRFALAELYDRFARADSFELYPDALPALERLRRAGLALAVVSNWDERLGAVLEGLGIAERVDTVVISSVLGYEKPDPRVFEAALARLDVRAEEAAHVGDRPKDDVEGAAALGMGAVLLDRRGRYGEGAEGDGADAADVVISSLDELPDALPGSALR